jgi:transcriptional regulator with XRE-family HTH domain
MINKEKFFQLVTKKDTKTLAEVKARIKNHAMLRESQIIALKVLIKLDELVMSKKDLAEKMGVSPQQITKIVSGKENLTIETQVKIQDALKIPILASYNENESNQEEKLPSISKEFKIEPKEYSVNENFDNGRVINMRPINSKYSPDFNFEVVNE